MVLPFFGFMLDIKKHRNEKLQILSKFNANPHDNFANSDIGAYTQNIERFRNSVKWRNKKKS